MWQIKHFKTRAAMLKWWERHEDTCQIVEVYVNNAYAVEYRRLMQIG